MYEAFFGLKERPFVTVPNPQTYFPGQTIEQARQGVRRIVQRGGGPSVVIGSVGTGKTLLSRVLARDLRSQFRVVLLSSTRICTRKGFLQAVLFELGLPYRDMDEGELRLALTSFVTSVELCPRGLILLVDEADRLPRAILEEVRMLTNQVRDDFPCVQPVLLGGRELDEIMTDPRLESLSQRIAGRFYLEPFSHGETLAYIRSRLAASGRRAHEVFSPGALEAVHRATYGVPRLINQVCEHAMLLAYVSQQGQLTEEAIQEAWSDLQQLPLVEAPAGQEDQAVIEFGRLDDDDAEVLASRPEETLEQIEGQLQKLDELKSQFAPDYLDTPPATAHGTWHGPWHDKVPGRSEGPPRDHATTIPSTTGVEGTAGHAAPLSPGAVTPAAATGNTRAPATSPPSAGPAGSVSTNATRPPSTSPTSVTPDRFSDSAEHVDFVDNAPEVTELTSAAVPDVLVVGTGWSADVTWVGDTPIDGTTFASESTSFGNAASTQPAGNDEHTSANSSKPNNAAGNHANAQYQTNGPGVVTAGRSGTEAAHEISSSSITPYSWQNQSYGHYESTLQNGEAAPDRGESPRPSELFEQPTPLHLTPNSAPSLVAQIHDPFAETFDDEEVVIDTIALPSQVGWQPTAQVECALSGELAAGVDGILQQLGQIERHTPTATARPAATSTLVTETNFDEGVDGEDEFGGEPVIIPKPRQASDGSTRVQPAPSVDISTVPYPQLPTGGPAESAEILQQTHGEFLECEAPQIDDFSIQHEFTDVTQGEGHGRDEQASTGTPRERQIARDIAATTQYAPASFEYEAPDDGIGTSALVEGGFWEAGALSERDTDVAGHAARSATFQVPASTTTCELPGSPGGSPVASHAGKQDVSSVPFPYHETLEVGGAIAAQQPATYDIVVATPDLPSTPAAPLDVDSFAAATAWPQVERRAPTEPLPNLKWLFSRLVNR